MLSRGPRSRPSAPHRRAARVDAGAVLGWVVQLAEGVSRHALLLGISNPSLISTCMLGRQRCMREELAPGQER